MQPIITTPRGIRQAVKQFKTEYPQHAQRYAEEIKQARRLAKRVHRDDTLGFLVGTLHRTEVYEYDPVRHRCACGKAMCEHRIAVNLAVMAEYWSDAEEHAARNLEALEANEVREELAESEASR
jgi:hypothetical protein